MAWNEATRAQYGRPHDDRQDDLTDAVWAPLIPRQGRPRATDLRRDPVPAVVGVPVAAQAALSSAVLHGSERLRNTGAGRPRRQPVGEDDGTRRALGT